MKNILITLSFIIFSTISYSQEGTNSIENFVIENNGVVYKKVFDIPNQSEIEIKKNILSFISKVPNVSNVKIVGDEIFGDIVNLKVNYKQFGGSYMSTLILLNHSMFGKLIVQTKDNRYRILIKDIYFIDDVSLLSLNSKKEMDNRTDFTNFITKNGRTEFRTSNTIIKGIGYMNSYFSEIFTYSNKPKENW
jgi:hypothetical protein